MVKKQILAVITAIVTTAGSLAAIGTPVFAEDQISMRDDSTTSKALVSASSTVSMYRLYNPNSSEHFYTSSAGEKNNLIRAGWKDEGVGWTAPAKSKTPVYRLYNPNAGDHHYTINAGERDSLIKAGWRNEGIGWYSNDEKKIPVYRQYNPNAKRAGAHNYTTSKGENDALVQAGWRAEGIGWYASGAGKSAAAATNSSGHKYPTMKEVGITGARYTDTLNAKLDQVLEKIDEIHRKNNIDPGKMSDYRKAYAILNYVGNYGYGDGTTAEEMLDTGSGTCMAYTDLIYCLARKYGLINTWPCVPGRPVDHMGPDGFGQINGSLHQLCVTRIGNKYYALDGNRAALVRSALQREIAPEEITESYARYLLGQTNNFTAINP